MLDIQGVYLLLQGLHYVGRLLGGFFGVILGYTDVLVLVYDEDSILGFTYGKVLVSTLISSEGLIVGSDEGTRLDSLVWVLWFK